MRFKVFPLVWSGPRVVKRMVPQQLQFEWLLHHGLTFLGEQPQLQSDRAAEGGPFIDVTELERGSLMGHRC